MTAFPVFLWWLLACRLSCSSDFSFEDVTSSPDGDFERYDGGFATSSTYYDDQMNELGRETSDGSGSTSKSADWWQDTSDLSSFSSFGDIDDSYEDDSSDGSPDDDSFDGSSETSSSLHDDDDEGDSEGTRNEPFIPDSLLEKCQAAMRTFFMTGHRADLDRFQWLFTSFPVVQESLVITEETLKRFLELGASPKAIRELLGRAKLVNVSPFQFCQLVLVADQVLECPDLANAIAGNCKMTAGNLAECAGRLLRFPAEGEERVETLLTLFKYDFSLDLKDLLVVYDRVLPLLPDPEAKFEFLSLVKCQHDWIRMADELGLEHLKYCLEQMNLQAVGKQLLDAIESLDDAGCHALIMKGENILPEAKSITKLIHESDDCLKFCCDLTSWTIHMYHTSDRACEDHAPILKYLEVALLLLDLPEVRAAFKDSVALTCALQNANLSLCQALVQCPLLCLGPEWKFTDELKRLAADYPEIARCVVRAKLGMSMDQLVQMLSGMAKDAIAKGTTTLENPLKPFIWLLPLLPDILNIDQDDEDGLVDQVIARVLEKSEDNIMPT